MADVADDETDRTCPGCGSACGAGDRFCEECGADLLVSSAGSPAPEVRVVAACVACGAAEIDEDGFCATCGHAQPASRDRVELDLAGVAGVSDRGLRHHRNEDAMALRVAAAAPGSGDFDRVVVVVCDGVSSSDRPDEASTAAADAAADVLLAAARSGADVEAATGAAVAAASSAVVELAATGPPDNAPACTLVCAVVTGEGITVGWIGDSRAYWLADGGSECLTVDDSWAERVVASGRFTAEEAFADPRSHALIAWLGADAVELAPHVRTFRPDGPGALLVCSDGLWNYLWEAADLASVALPAAATPLAAATALTAVALAGGGHDNITVAVVPFPTRTAAGPGGDTDDGDNDDGDEQDPHAAEPASTRSANG